MWPVGWRFANVKYVDPSLWTLTIELTFYVLFGLTVAWRGLTYRRVLMFCVAWMTTSLAAPWIHERLFVMVVQPVYAPFFCGGIVMYLIYRFRPNPYLWVTLAYSYGLSIYQLDGRTYAQHRSGWFMNYAVASAIMTIFFLVLLAAALGRLNWVRGRWLVSIGAVTYPVYLIHQQIGETLIRSLLPSVSPWPLIVIMFAFVVLLAWLIHRLVERPVGGWLKRRLTRQKAPQPRIPIARISLEQHDVGSPERVVKTGPFR